MKKVISVDDFTVERQCEFKQRTYSVRDNGAVFRYARPGIRPGKLDNEWTFGQKDSKSGYMMLSGVRVHQIVATAFHGEAPEANMVVDHKDANRCNNRPENLAWITRLENILNNPFTRRRIALTCGSIEAFLENPAKFRDKFREPNFSWMGTVSPEDAAKCKKNLERWASEDQPMKSQSKGLGDLVFGDIEEREDNGFGRSWDMDWALRQPKSDYHRQMEAIEEDNLRRHEQEYGLKDSLTDNALQLNWKVPSKFPLCPTVKAKDPLTEYLANIHEGGVFCRNDIYESIAYKAEISDDGQTLAVITTNSGVKGMSGYCLTTITFKDDKYIHENQGSFFEEVGALKYFTIALGHEWDGDDVFDDYC